MRRVLLCVVALSCVKTTAEPAPVTPPPEAVAVRAPDVEPEPPQPSPQEDEDGGEDEDEDEDESGETGEELAEPPEKAMEAFVDDCHHEFKILDDEVGKLFGECAYIPFDQMCVADPSGCFDDHEMCDSKCPGVCTSCDGKCGSKCDGCKAKCGDNPTCIHKCAQKRFNCNERCMAKKEKCFDKCNRAAEECYAEFAEEVEQTCECEAVLDCLQNSDAEEPYEACQEKFSDHPECVDWCVG